MLRRYSSRTYRMLKASRGEIISGRRSTILIDIVLVKSNENYALKLLLLRVIKNSISL